MHIRSDAGAFVADEERAQLHSAKDDSGFSYHVLSPEEAKEKAERRKHGGDKLNELKDGCWTAGLFSLDICCLNRRVQLGETTRAVRALSMIIPVQLHT